MVKWGFISKQNGKKHFFVYVLACMFMFMKVSKCKTEYPHEAASDPKQTVYVSVLCHNPLSSPSLRFLGWAKHIVLTHRRLMNVRVDWDTRAGDRWPPPEASSIPPTATLRSLGKGSVQPTPLKPSKFSLIISNTVAFMSKPFCYRLFWVLCIIISTSWFTGKCIKKDLTNQYFFQHTASLLYGLFGHRFAPVKQP